VQLLLLRNVVIVVAVACDVLVCAAMLCCFEFVCIDANRVLVFVFAEFVFVCWCCVLLCAVDVAADGCCC